MRRPIVPGSFTAGSNSFIRQGRARTILAPSPSTVVTLGWTEFLPSVDSRIIYVSSTDGDDANDGLSDASPKLTLIAALNLLRDTFPDHVRLKRGDVWTGERIRLNGISGRSAAERMVVETYGPETDARPLLRTGLNAGIELGFAATHNYLAFLDIDCIAHNRDPGDPSFDTGLPFFDDNAGISATSRGSYWHFEGCRFSYYASGSVIQNIDGPIQPLDQITVRRCAMLDSYVDAAGFAQGMYFHESNNLLVEENIIDRVNYDDGTIFDHALYFQNGNTVPRRVILRDNVITRCDGAQLRDGGVCTNNLFVKTWISIQLGGGNAATVGGASATASNNVILDGEDINGIDSRGWGFFILNIDGTIPGTGVSTIFNNIIANNTTATFPRPFYLDSGASFDNAEPNKITNLTINNNIVYNWGGSGIDAFGPNFTNLAVNDNVVRSDIALTQGWSNNVNAELADVSASSNRFWSITADAATDINDGTGLVSYAAWEAQLSAGSGNQHEEVTYADPSRSVPRYYNEVIGGAATFSAFIAAARDNRKGAWEARLLAPPINNWIRNGFVET